MITLNKSLELQFRFMQSSKLKDRYSHYVPEQPLASDEYPLKLNRFVLCQNAGEFLEKAGILVEEDDRLIMQLKDRADDKLIIQLHYEPTQTVLIEKESCRITISGDGCLVSNRTPVVLYQNKIPLHSELRTAAEIYLLYDLSPTHSSRLARYDSRIHRIQNNDDLEHLKESLLREDCYYHMQEIAFFPPDKESKTFLLDYSIEDEPFQEAYVGEKILQSESDFECKRMLMDEVDRFYSRVFFNMVEIEISEEMTDEVCFTRCYAATCVFYESIGKLLSAMEPLVSETSRKITGTSVSQTDKIILLDKFKNELKKRADEKIGEDKKLMFKEWSYIYD